MTAQALPFPIIYAPPLPCFFLLATTLGSNITMQLNAAGDKLAFVFRANSTTVPDQVCFRVAGVVSAGTAGTIDCTLETVATDGTPSGTPVTNSATGSATISTTGQKTISGMAGTATVTVGTDYAIVIAAGSGWDRNMTILTTTGSSQGALSFPYNLTKDTAGAWTKVGGTHYGWAIGLLDSGGTAIMMPGFAGNYSMTLAAFSDSTNPDERGNRFLLPVPTVCWGAIAVYSGGSTPGTNDNFSLSLYSSHTATPSQMNTTPYDGDTQGGNFPHILLLDSPQIIAANTAYALAFKATGSENASIARWDYSSAAIAACLAGADIYSTTRDGGAGAPANPGNNFTDDTTKVYGLFPLLSKFDDGAGGGGVPSRNLMQGNLG